MKQQNVSTVALIIALGGFLFGYDIAMMSGTTSQLEQLFDLKQLLAWIYRSSCNNWNHNWNLDNWANRLKNLAEKNH